MEELRRGGTTGAFISISSPCPKYTFFLHCLFSFGSPSLRFDGSRDKGHWSSKDMVRWGQEKCNTWSKETPALQQLSHRMPLTRTKLFKKTVVNKGLWIVWHTGIMWACLLRTYLVLTFTSTCLAFPAFHSLGSPNTLATCMVLTAIFLGLLKTPTCCMMILGTK